MPERISDAAGNMRESLFALVEAAGELLNAPILLEDTEFRVLAWSKGQHTADEERVSGILERHAQPWLVDVLRSRGEISRLIASPEPIFIEPASPQAKPRMACRVQHDGPHLGYLWASTEKPFEHRKSAELLAVAQAIADHMTRPDGHTADAARQADLETVLFGGPTVDEAAARLGFLSTTASVLAAATSRQAEAVSGGAHSADALALYLTMAHPHFVIGHFDQVTYAVLLWPTPMDPLEARARSKKIAEGFWNRSAWRKKIVLAISDTVGYPHRTSEARSQADRIITVQREFSKVPSVALFDDIQLTYLLTRLRALLRQDGTVLGGQISLLEQHDRKNNTDFLSTLMCYLESFGDVNSAAENMHLHPNTFRYRMRRIKEISSFDTQDPDMRFLAELQLRLRELN